MKFVPPYSVQLVIRKYLTSEPDIINNSVMTPISLIERTDTFNSTRRYAINTLEFDTTTVHKEYSQDHIDQLILDNCS